MFTSNLYSLVIFATLTCSYAADECSQSDTGSDEHKGTVIGILIGQCVAMPVVFIALWYMFRYIMGPAPKAKELSLQRTNGAAAPGSVNINGSQTVAQAAEQPVTPAVP